MPLDHDGQRNTYHIIAILNAINQCRLAALINEIVNFLNVADPLIIIPAPTIHLTVHFRIDDVDHAVEYRVHVVTTKVRIAQIRPAIYVRCPEILIVQKRVENRDVPLASRVVQTLRIARVRIRSLRWNAGVVRAVTKRVVHVPEGIPPALRIAIGMATTPPSRIPIEPVCTHDKRIQQHIIDEAHGIEYAFNVLVVGRI